MRRATKWRATTWERVYRGQAIWVEEMFSQAPKWSWSAEDGGEGRAMSKLAAMRAAERHVATPQASDGEDT